MVVIPDSAIDGILPVVQCIQGQPQEARVVGDPLQIYSEFQVSLEEFRYHALGDCQINESKRRYGIIISYCKSS
jgi:hypothetical protein